MMSHIAIVLLFAAATPAQGNLMPWQKTPAGAHSLMKQLADIKGRRLIASLMSPECGEKCPKIMDMITALGEAGDVGEDPSKVTEAFCPYVESLTCAGKEDVCMADETTKAMMEGFMMIPCMCSCPALAEMENMDAENPNAEACEFVSCMMGADTCASMVAMIEGDEDAKKVITYCDSVTEAPAPAPAPAPDSDTAPPTTDFAPTQAAPAAAAVMGLTVIALVA